MEPASEAPSPAHSRRNVGGERACPSPRQRARRRAGPVACGGDRESGARADPAAGRRLRRRGGACSLSRGRRRRCGRRRDPSVRGAHLRQRDSRLPRRLRAARRLHPTALDAAGRRSLERSRLDGGGGRRARAEPRTVFLTQGGCSSPRSRARPSTAMSCAPSTGRRASTLFPSEADPRPRAIRARRRTRADAGRADRDRSSARTAAAKRPTPRSRRRAALGVRVVMVRRPKAPDAETVFGLDAALPGSPLIGGLRRSAASASRPGRRRGR